jgi:acyl phosphate:glycerol-3-phosphate acyltransferase
MNKAILFFLCWVFGYLSGSLPFAVWVMRWTKGIDVRDGGSGHMTATNTIRQAGWVPGILVFLLDTAKGYIPIYIAIHLGLPDWAVGLAAMLAVIGHCWPVFAQFRGGKGLAVTGGILLAVSPPGFLISAGVLIFFVLVTRHAARGSLFAALVIPAVLWWAGYRGAIIYVMVLAGLVIAGRFFVDWNRKYRELWLDRQK